MSRSLLVLAAISVVTFHPSPAIPENEPGCRFSLSPNSMAPKILRGDAIEVPVRVLPQPDSPVAIIEADLRQMSLTVASTGFEQHGTGTNAIALKNISDRVLTRVDVAVQTRTNEGGAGDIVTSRTALEPGATAQLQLRIGGGSGTARDGVAELVLLVESVEMSGCYYKPSQPWP